MDSVQRARELAMAMSNGINTLALVAAPRVLASMAHEEARDALHGAAEPLTKLVDVLGSGGGLSAPMLQPAEALDALSKLIPRLVAWDGAMPLVAETVQLGRVALAALGVPEPPGGWDAFEAPKGAAGP